MPTKKTTRRNMPLFITLPPDERARVDAFAAKLGRPYSWLVRDAVTVYLDALEANSDRLAALQVDMTKAGRTVARRQGRPPKVKESVNVR